MSDVTLRYLLTGEDRSASKSIQGVSHQATSMATKVGGAFSKLGGTIGGEVGEVLNKIGEGLENVGEHGMSAGQKLTVAGGALTGIGVAFQAIGSKDKQAADQLHAAISATGNSVSDFSDQIEKTVGHMENYGHTSADTQQALASLTEATNDPKKALDNMGLAADLAAAKHISLNDAAVLLGKGLDGQGRVFKQYGIQLQTNKDGTKDVEDATRQLAERLQGQASASVDNFGGKVDVIKTKIEDWAAKVGNKLGPVMTAIGPTLMVVGTAMEIMRARQEAAAAATVTETVATEAQGVAARGMAAAQAVLNAVMDANPIMLVVVAVAALAAGLVLAWQHSATFRDIVRGAFDGVKAAGADMWNALKDAFQFITDAFLTVAGAIIHGAADAFGWVPGIGGKLKAAARHFDEFRQSVNDALDGIHKQVDINVVINAVNRARDSGGLTSQGAAKAVQGARAAGGPVGAGGTYLVGEQGPELVTFGASGQVLTAGQTAAALGGGDTYNLTVNAGAGADGQSIARVVLSSLQDMKRRGTNLGLA